MTIQRLFPAILLLFGCTLYSAPPNFEISKIPHGKFAPLRKEISQYVDVFGITIVATPRTEERKVVHAANVLAEYMDNDEDGEIDDPAVHRTLLDGGKGFAKGDVFEAAFRDGASGELVTAGAFIGTGRNEMTCNLQSALMRAEATEVVVMDANGEIVLTAQL